MKLLELPSLCMQINLYSLVSVIKDRRIKVISKAINNNRKERSRPESDHKAITMPHPTFEYSETTFANVPGAFGREWARVYKKDIYA